jgi:hypothetical protein
LPWQAQITTYKTAALCDANGDALPDVLLMGNFYDNNVQMGRYDADYGTMLINKGKGIFEPTTIKGLSLKGQVRKIKPIQINKNASYILALNSDSIKMIQFNKLHK